MNRLKKPLPEVSIRHVGPVAGSGSRAAIVRLEGTPADVKAAVRMLKAAVRIGRTLTPNEIALAYLRELPPDQLLADLSKWAARRLRGEKPAPPISLIDPEYDIPF